MRICLFRPDMPGNFGTIIRTLACFGIFEIDVILPTGFAMNSREIKRSMMDYGCNFEIRKFSDFDEYIKVNPLANIVLLTTKTSENYTDCKFQNDSILLFGSESSGVSNNIHDSVSKKYSIKMHEGMRSLNLAVSVGIVLGEARRQVLSKNV